MKLKNLNRAIIAITMMLIGIMPSMAYDFEVDGIYYNIISTANKYVSVTHAAQENVYSEESVYSGDIIIPATVDYKGKTYEVVEIGEMAFYEAKISSVEFGENILHVRESAFERTTGLSSIKLNDKLKSIEYYAFNVSTANLSEICIPDNVVEICSYAFRPDLDSVTVNVITIGSKVKILGNGAFSCIYVNEINCKSTTPPEYDTDTDDLFSTYDDPQCVYHDAILYVPIGCKEAYENAPVWCRFYNIQEKDFSVDANVNTISKDNTISVSGKDGRISVLGANNSDALEVFTIGGIRIVESNVLNIQKVSFDSGTYIVKVNGQSFKIIL